MRQEWTNFIQERPERPIHPGEAIADILDELGMTSTDFAKILGVSYLVIDEVIQGKRPITVDLAIRIGQALGNGHSLWLNLQQKVDVWDAWHTHQADYERVLTLASFN